MKLGIACDHRGYNLKNKLVKYLKKKYEIVDYGCDTKDSVDYVDFAVLLCQGILNKEVDKGILICGTGIGMSIAANKINGIMCAKVDNKKEAYYSVAHNNANIISISSGKTLVEAKNIVNTYLSSSFMDYEKYKRRIEKINLLEKNSSK